MPRFSKTSKERLETCHQDIQTVMNQVVKVWDCTILCGHRDEEDQTKAFETGRSKVSWPNSKHNKTPSMAVDAAPYPIDWDDLERFRRFAWFVKGVAAGMGIVVRLGADWDNDNSIIDQTFHDLPHIELVAPREDY